MQYSTFAAIDIGSYDVILEIFEISKKQGIRSVDKICHRMELGKDTYTLGKIRPEMEEELCRVLADFVRIMEGYRVDDYRATASSNPCKISCLASVLRQRQNCHRTGLGKCTVSWEKMSSSKTSDC